MSEGKEEKEYASGSSVSTTLMIKFDSKEVRNGERIHFTTTNCTIIFTQLVECVCVHSHLVDKTLQI